MFNRRIHPQAIGGSIIAATLFSEPGYVVCGYSNGVEGVSGGSVLTEPWDVADLACVYTMSYSGMVDIVFGFVGDVVSSMAGKSFEINGHVYVASSADIGPSYIDVPYYYSYCQFINVGSGHALTSGVTYAVTMR